MGTMSTDDGLQLSVIMPAYNEEGSIRQAVEEINANVLATIPKSELIVIDDGSKDSTSHILDELAQHYPLRVVHQDNCGHGGALLKGLSIASGNFLFLLDSDRQIPLESFKLLWQHKDEYDGIFGVRVKRVGSPIRLLLAQLIRWSIDLLFSVKLQDANAPFKLLNRKVWEAVKPIVPEGTLAPSIFIAVFAAKNFRILEVGVSHRNRQTGSDSLPNRKLLQFCSEAFKQLLSFRNRMTT
jgi:dolichol-phosphate mannosyltransferase